MKKTEIILLTLSIIAIGFNLLLIPGGGILTVLIYTILSIFYFYFSFALFNNISLRKIFNRESYQNLSRKRIIGAVGAGFALSIVVASIMFQIQLWPGADFLLASGIFGLLIVTLWGFSKYRRSKSDYYIKIFKRTAIFSGITLVVMFFPKTKWIEFKYRDQPAYVEALKKAMANPDDSTLWDTVERERQKVNTKKNTE